MTDNLESNSPEGSAGSPNPAVSNGQNVSSTSKNEVLSSPEQLESFISKSIEKALQSQKDKRISSIEKKLDDFNPVMEQVKSMLTPEQQKQFAQIQRDAEFDELKKRVYGDASTNIPETGTQKNVALIETQTILKDYKLDGNDPEVIEKVVKQNFSSETEARLAAANLAFQRLNPTPQSASASTAFVGSTPRVIDNEEIDAQIVELSKNRTLNKEKIEALKKQRG